MSDNNENVQNNNEEVNHGGFNILDNDNNANEVNNQNNANSSNNNDVVKEEADPPVNEHEPEPPKANANTEIKNEDEHPNPNDVNKNEKNEDKNNKKVDDAKKKQPEVKKSKEREDKLNALMFMNNLNVYNSTYRTNVDANAFVDAVTNAWELLKTGDEAKKKEAQKIMSSAFKNALKEAFKNEKELSYNEHRLPKFNDIIKDTNDLLRTSMFAFTDLYTNRKSALHYEFTTFGAMTPKEMAELTKGESIWDMDQKSDEAWEIQAASAKDLATEWLKTDKPYETMIKEMNKLVESAEKKEKLDHYHLYNKLAAAEWMLLNNDKMMIDNPEDPLNKMPDWGNRYWKSIIQAREALGIPKHISTRELIQGDYARAKQAVTSVAYNEKQIEEYLYKPEERTKIDSLDKQKEAFAKEREEIDTKDPENEKKINSLEMKENRVRFPIESENEYKKMQNAPKSGNFIVDDDKKLEKNPNNQIKA